MIFQSSRYDFNFAFFSSLIYILDNSTPKTGQFPLLDGKLDLKESNILLVPSPEELLEVFNTLSSSILKIADLVPRLTATHGSSSYMVSLLRFL